LGYEPDPTWYYDVDLTATAGNFTAGNFGVIDQLPYQECVNYQWKFDIYPTDFSCLTAGLGANGNYAYAAGEGYSDVRLRYKPAYVATINKNVTWVDGYPYGHYDVHITVSYALLPSILDIKGLDIC